MTDNLQKSENSERKSWKGSVLASMHGIVICGLLLTSFCFAWFTEVVKGPNFTVKTASYGIWAGVSCNGVVVTSGDYSGATDEGNPAIEVENGKSYEIILDVSENPKTEYGGYCIVSAGDDLHYTVPIGGEKDGVKNPEKISFQIWFPGTGTSRIEFLPYWGTYPATLPEEWKKGDILGVEDIIISGKEYVVSGGDITLSDGDNEAPEKVSLIEPE